MLIGIVADVYRDTFGTFCIDIMPDTIADGLSEAIELAYEHEDTDPDDLLDATAIMDFLRGPLGHAVKWTVR